MFAGDRGVRARAVPGEIDMLRIHGVLRELAEQPASELLVTLEIEVPELVVPSLASIRLLETHTYGFRNVPHPHHIWRNCAPYLPISDISSKAAIQFFPAPSGTIARSNHWASQAYAFLCLLPPRLQSFMSGLNLTVVASPDSAIQEAHSLVENLLAAPPSGYSKFINRLSLAAESAPTMTLKYLPEWFLGFKSGEIARECRPALQRLYDFPLQAIRAQMESGTAKPSFLLSHLERVKETEPQNYDDVKWAAAAMFGSTSFYRLKAAPEVMVSSWHPPTELGVPHALMEDAVYEGMFIPKGSTVFANIRGEHIQHPSNSSRSGYRISPRCMGSGGATNYCMDPTYPIYYMQ
ncbi:hypothetical protein C8J57DRAFT_1569139 [Mycena rebaudengoi]|nr:hypothetical protein C8J57DRAFT_1569139 [Mycena rebaudengoi]